MFTLKYIKYGKCRLTYMQNNVKNTNSVALKLSLLSFSFVIAACVISLILSIYFYQKDMYAVNGEAMLALADSISAGIEGDDFDKFILDPEVNDYLLNLKTHLDKVKTKTDVVYLYLLTYRNGKLVSLAEGMKPSDDPELISGLMDEPDEEIYAPETLATLKTGTASISDPYDTDDFGKLVTASVPIFSAE